MTQGQRQDPAAWLELLDPWARHFLAELRAEPWRWRGRVVESGYAGSGQAADAGYGMTMWERAAKRSLYWCNSHAASSGAKIRPSWSLEVTWLAPVDGPPARYRRRVLLARVMPRQAGREFYAAQASGRPQGKR